MDNHFDEPNIEPTGPETPVENAPTSPKKEGYRFRVVSFILAVILGIAGAYLWATSTADSRARKAENGKYSETVRAKLFGAPLCMSDSGNTCSISYEYEVNGKTYTKTFDNLSASDLINNADSILRYDPNNPADAIMPENTIDPDANIKKWRDGNTAALAKVAMGIAALFLIDAFVGYYINSFRESLRDKKQEVISKLIDPNNKEDGSNGDGTTGSI